MNIHPYTFRSNEPDDTHCLQACVGMAVEAQTGTHLSMRDIEEATGYISRRATWNFQAMLTLADMGLRLTSIEQFDPEHFAADPEAHIRRQAGDEQAAAWVISQSDLDLEAKRVQACIEHPNIEFQVRQPTIEDLIEQTTLGTVVTNVNYQALVGNSGYTGHFVVVVDASTDRLVLDNPGLPPIEHQHVPIEQFIAAWHSPQPDLANLMTVAARTSDARTEGR